MMTRDEIIAEISRIEDELLVSAWNPQKFDGLVVEYHVFHSKLFQLDNSVSQQPNEPKIYY